MPCGLLPVYDSEDSDAILALDRCTGQISFGDSQSPDRWLFAAPNGTPAIAWARDDITVEMVQGASIFTGAFGPWNGVGEGEFPDPAHWVHEDSNGVRTQLFYGPGAGGTINIAMTNAIWKIIAMAKTLVYT